MKKLYNELVFIKKIYGFAFIILILFSSSCSRRIPFMIYNDDGKKIDKVFQNILLTINAKENETLKTLFSQNVLEGSKTINEDIDYLFTFFNGAVKSWKRISTNTNTNSNYGHVIKGMNVTFEAETEKQKYLVYIYYYFEDTKNPKNVGIYTLRIIKEEDKETQWTYWQDMKIPGIYRYKLD